MNPAPETPRANAFVVGEGADWRARVLAALAAVPVAARGFASGREALAQLGPEIALLLAAAQSSDISGLALCRRVRELPGGDVMLLVLSSARDDEMERVLAFENGVDDFVSEPFFPRELVVRVRALLRRGRRSGRADAPDEIVVGALRADLRKGLVEVGGERVRLTRREFEVLRQLILSEGRVVAREELLGTLDGESRASARLVDTYVKSIRAKLGPARDVLETVRGVGYRFDAERA